MGESVSALSAQGTESGFIYMYLYLCFWGDHFSEERGNFEPFIGITSHHAYNVMCTATLSSLQA